MKITHLFSFAVLLCVVGSCQQSAGNDAKPAAESEAQPAEASAYTCELPIHGSFNQVTVVSDMDVELRTGPCRIQATGDSATIAQMRYDIDMNGLILSNPSEENSDVNRYGNRNGLRVTVWAPEWRIVANCGNGRLVSHGALRSSFLQLGCIREGRMDVDTLLCDTFRYDGSGHSRCQIGLIRGGSAEVSVTGWAQSAMHLDVDSLFSAADMEASASFTGHARATEVEGNVTIEQQ